MRYALAGTIGPPTPSSSAIFARRTASITMPAELALSSTSRRTSMLYGMLAHCRPSIRMNISFVFPRNGTKSDGPTYIWSSSSLSDSWLCTLSVFDMRLLASRSCSFMFRKSVLPPTLIWYVLSMRVPRSLHRRASVRCTIVAPTWPFMSSPTTGTPRSANRPAHSGSDAMNDGMQLTNAAPVSRQTRAQKRVASSEPTGRYDTMISAPVSRTTRRTRSASSSSVPDCLIGFTLFCTHMPTPSSCGASWTSAPVRGMSPRGTQSTMFGYS